MAQFKCKMCGGIIETSDNKAVCECEFCGTLQTVPTFTDNQKLSSLHNRANTLRLKNEFDKALITYENIVVENPKDAEAHWGIVLCRYGIEYVDDPKTGKKIPTCHRTQTIPIFEDTDYKDAIKYSDVIARKMYQDEAEEINKIQKGILAISIKEDPYDIFICYKENDGKRTRDSVIAQEIYTELIKKNYRVFFSRITLESKLGTQYEPYIYAALKSSKVMLVLGTKPEYFNAVWVKNEWARFLNFMNENSEKKYIIPCYRDMDAYDLPDELLSFQAQDMNKLGFIQDLLRGIDKLFNKEEKKEFTVEEELNPEAFKTVNSLLRRAELLIEDSDFDRAREIIEDVLNINPENSKAYLLLCLINHKCNSIQKLCENGEKIEEDKNFKRSLQFASDKEKTELEEFINNNIAFHQLKFASQYFDAVSYDEKKLSIRNSIANLKNIDKYKELYEIAQSKINTFYYNKGVRLYSSKNYNEALEAFSLCIKFEKADDFIQKITGECEKYNKENYEKGIQKFREEKWDEAESFFKNCQYYKDTNEYLNKVSEMINNNKIYLEAVELLNKIENALSIKKKIRSAECGKFIDAINSLQSNDKLPYDYKDFKDINEKLIDYKERLKKDKIIIERSEIRKNKTISILSILAVILVIIFIILIIIIQKNLQHKKEEELKIRKEEITAQLADYKYTISDDISEVTVVGYNGTKANLVIPNCVTVIGARAFENCKSLESITLPENLDRIEYGAFKNCSELTNIKIPKNISRIEDYTFDDCTSLVSVNFPDNLKSIGNYAFRDCCSLYEVNIKNKMNLIGDDAFSNCINLIELNLEKGVKKIGASAFYSCCSLVAVNIQGNIEEIGASAFHSCSSLNSIELPYGLKDIEQSTFSGCSALEVVYVPETVENILNYAFSGCIALSSINLNNGLKEIGSYAFETCTSLENIDLPETLKELGRNAFDSCSLLEKIDIPNGVEKISSFTFYGCTSLKYVTLPQSITLIDSRAFSGCTSLIDINFPNGLKLIGEFAFYNCTKLSTEINLKNVETIERYAFCNCASIVSIKIPIATTVIGDYAFSKCDSLKIFCESEIKPDGWSDLWNNSDCPVYWGRYY